ncbi:polyketide synthase dehydratase domain-containing protein, partial [Streptomyces tricolor]|nr:polyketide synthase dehydratase domain-containing protein [Streptomyces tricolor]
PAERGDRRHRPRAGANGPSVDRCGRGSAGQRRSAVHLPTLPAHPPPGWPTTPSAGWSSSPAAALVELAVRAGDEVGCGTVDALTVTVPLVLPEQGGVRVQVAVGGADESGCRTVTVYSTREDATEVIGAEAWVRHATGVLTATPKPGESPQGDFGAWPPVGARRVDVEALYRRPGPARLRARAPLPGRTRALAAR